MSAILPEGIRLRHRASCPITSGGQRCRCRPAYHARVSTGNGRRLSGTFDTLDEAAGWLERYTARKPGGSRPGAPTIRQMALELIEDLEAGTALNRNGEPYKPNVVRGYIQALHGTIIPTLGDDPVDQVTPQDVQDLVDVLRRQAPKPRPRKGEPAPRKAAGGQTISASRIRNLLVPLKVIYRRAIFRGYVQASPITTVTMPADRGRREEHVPAHLVLPMIEAIEDPTARCGWAVMFLAGLRAGELLGLRWSDIDQAAGVLRVEQAWCSTSHQMIAPKTRKSVRHVPIAPELAAELDRLYALQQPDTPGHLLMRKPSDPGLPLSIVTITRRAQACWEAADPQLPTITAHAARHSWGTLAVEGGMPLHDVARHMGHSDLKMVMERYAHLQPGTYQRSASIISRAVSGQPTS